MPALYQLSYLSETENKVDIIINPLLSSQSPGLEEDRSVGWDLNPISWLCLPPNSQLMIIILRLLASSELLH